MLVVTKYGGSSLADSRKLEAAAEAVAQEKRTGAALVVVVSARGKTTDSLLALARQAGGGPPRELDACLAAGEQVSAALLAMALEKRGCSAVSLTGLQAGILTDGVRGDARVTGLDDRRIRRELARGRVVVVAGFQGVGPEGDVVTLGRGGSDTTAVALAAFLQADACRICTDVDGVYEEDPRKNPAARRFERLSCDEMLALCRRGAGVLHDRAAELAKEKGVRLEICSSFGPGPGTVIGSEKVCPP